MKKKNTTTQIIALLLVAVLIVISLFAAPPAGLSVEGFRCLILLICAFILWLTNALPIPITCLLMISGFFFLGILKKKEIFAASGSNAVFFLLAGFGIGAALMKTNVAYILLRAIMNWAGRSTRKIIAGFVILTSFISLFVSNGVAAVIVSGIAASVMKAVGDPQPGTSNFLKGLMMAVPMGAMCGGLASPASNSLNVTVQSLLESSVGVEILFLDWCKIGVPMAILMTAVVAFVIPLSAKSAPLNDEEYGNFQKMFDTIPEKLEAKDYKFIIIMLVLVVLWISSNWIKTIDTTFTAILGLGVMFLPGVNLLSGKDYLKSVKPLGLIMLLCCVPLATAMSKTGAGQWLVDTLFGGAMGASPIILYALITIVALIIHFAVPSGSGNATLSATLMFPVAFAAGLSMHATAVIVCTQAGNNFLSPIEGLYSYTFCYDHFDFKDTMKAGFPITIFELIVCIVLIPALAGIFGLG